MSDCAITVIIVGTQLFAYAIGVVTGRLWDA